MTLVLSDNIIADIAALKHYTQTLRNENVEMKQSLANLSVSRYELTNEVKALKGIISQLVAQQSLVNTSLTNVSKETKFLMKENFQHKSKLEILQIRMKNLQGSQGKDQTQKMTSPRTEPDDKEDLLLDFPRSPRAENVVNKNTKDRLESLKRDLQSVFNKKEEKNEPVKGEKEMIMDEWPSQSDLNISQTHSEDRMQNISPVENQLFNARANQGQRSSLMEQVAMLNMPHNSHKEHFMYEPVLETGNNAVNVKRDNIDTRKVYNNDGLATHRDNIIPISGILQSTGVTMTSNQNQNMTGRPGVEILNRNILDERKLSAVKPGTGSDISHLTKSAAPHSYTLSTTAGVVTQNSLSSSSSLYPVYNAKPDEHNQKYEYSSPGTYQSYGYSSFGGGFGGADAKIKKELYSQGDNMLINMLDRLEEQPHRTGNDQYYLDSDMYRYQNKPQIEISQGHGGGFEDPEKMQTNANDVSTTLSNSSRGTKRLKLFKKGTKNKEFESQKDGGTGNVSYGNQL